MRLIQTRLILTRLILTRLILTRLLYVSFSYCLMTYFLLSCLIRLPNMNASSTYSVYMPFLSSSFICRILMPNLLLLYSFFCLIYKPHHTAWSSRIIVQSYPPSSSYLIPCLNLSHYPPSKSTCIIFFQLSHTSFSYIIIPYSQVLSSNIIFSTHLFRHHLYLLSCLVLKSHPHPALSIYYSSFSLILLNLSSSSILLDISISSS